MNASKSPRLNNQLLHVPKMYIKRKRYGKVASWNGDFTAVPKYFSTKAKKGCKGKVRLVLRFWRLIEVIFRPPPSVPLGKTLQRP
jgi:hypothetical protein